jgi:hypothetical protein
MHFIGQFRVLLQRQFIRRRRDLLSLALQIGQAPLLGLMIGFAFQRALINSPLFLFSFIAVWFGTNATARELVGERSLFLREKRGGVSPGATLLAKLTSHGLILLVQVVLLFLSARLVIGFDANPLWVILILWLTGLCGAVLGFVISALAKTELAATAATPLVLVPLILFGGYLAPYKDMSAPIKALSEIMPTRWSYQALVEAEKSEQEDHDGQSAEQRAEEIDPDGALMNEERASRIRVCLSMLAAGSVLLTAITWQRLRAARS